MSYFEIFAIIGAFLIPFILIWLVLYGLEAYALYLLAKNNGHQDMAALAFIPFLNRGLYGIFAGAQAIFGTQVSQMALAGILAFAPVVGIFLHGIATWILTILIVIITYYALKAVYGKMNNISDSNLFAIVAALIPICRVIFVFLHKDDIFVEEGEVVE